MQLDDETLGLNTATSTPPIPIEEEEEEEELPTASSSRSASPTPSTSSSTQETIQQPKSVKDLAQSLKGFKVDGNNSKPSKIVDEILEEEEEEEEESQQSIKKSKKSKSKSKALPSHGNINLVGNNFVEEDEIFSGSGMSKKSRRGRMTPSLNGVNSGISTPSGGIDGSSNFDQDSDDGGGNGKVKKSRRAKGKGKISSTSTPVSGISTPVGEIEEVDKVLGDEKKVIEEREVIGEDEMSKKDRRKLKEAKKANAGTIVDESVSLTLFSSSSLISFILSSLHPLYFG